MLKYFESILKNSKLSRQVTIILSTIFVAVAALNCFLLFPLIESGSQVNVESEALALINFYSSLYQSISYYCRQVNEQYTDAPAQYHTRVCS